MESSSIIKILVLGASGVGKTSLMQKYISNEFRQQYKATLGSDFYSKPVTIRDESGAERSVELQIWDTAGTERYQGLGLAFYRGSNACILVFDLTSQESFAELDHWYDEFCIQADPPNPEKFPFIVVGNKADLTPHRMVTAASAKLWCEQKGSQIAYFECSAKDGQNVENLFRLAGELGLENEGDVDDNQVPIGPYEEQEQGQQGGPCKC